MNDTRESLSKDLVMSVGSGLNGKPSSDEALIDALFVLFSRATTHTISWIITKHSSLVVELMASKYAHRDRGHPDDE